MLLRGDRHVSEVKLQNLLGCLELSMASDETVEKFGGKAGYLGPVGIKGIEIIADCEVPLMYNYVTGANEEGYHLLNVNYQRGDFVIDKVADIREVTAGEKCPHCGGVLQGARGIEIGQIFKLHDKYSRLLEANYTDEEGVERPAVMGCYGIGVGRTMAAVIEQSNDEYGIIWPMAVAPYQVVVIPVNDKDEALTAAAKKIYDELLRAKVEVVIDDRKERPGVKFNDADLIGYPLRIVVGSKSLAKGVVEVKIRATGETMEIPVEEITEWTKKRIGEELTK